MSEELTYYGALEILGKPKSRLVTMLDAAATAGLTAWATVAMASGKSAEPPLSLMELKNDVVRFGHEVVRRVSEWRSGLSRFDRTQRLAAAHAVLVVSSFFETLDEVDTPVTVERLVLIDPEQVALATRRRIVGGYAAMIELLLQEQLPLPEPHRTFAYVRENLVRFYERLTAELLAFVHALPVWDEIDEGTSRQAWEVYGNLTVAAVERYDNSYRNLAVDNREFEVWAHLTERRALDTALAGVSSLLADMSTHQPGVRSLNHLAMAYQAGLNESIAGSGQAPDEVILPSLGDAYVSPYCRVAAVPQGSSPASQEWWEHRPLLEDVEAFIAGYLTSPRATRAPLVVLGEPGSGKSTFVQVLAARLTERDFLPVLVPLRDVTAESLVQEQIEQAIYRGPGDRVNWPDLVDAAGGALPVVLLDGFDELIQAASVSRYDYLEQVKDFQRRQAQIGRPVAVIVTSRTVMADKARFPAGSLALQLQPFTEDQVRCWLEIWERCNAAGFAARRLRSLPVSTALVHGELAEQPLLLLMLAIFDAASNELQRAEARIGRAELYERLLTEFALREIRKSAANRALSTDRQFELAERELQRLALVALAMFARGRQSTSDSELNHDMPILFSEDDDGEDAPLTPAQRATGRFFFVHKSEARRHDNRTHSYEFLHATFGEFLVARLTVSALRDLASLREVMRRATTASGSLDDGFLHAVLSFSCLASRAPIIAFLNELMGEMPSEEQARCRAMLTELITASLLPHPNRSFQDYEPEQHSIPRRLAVYSANLVVLLTLISGEINATEFCGPQPGKIWEQYGYLWRSAFTSAEWNGITDTIRVRVGRPDDSLEIWLTKEDGTPISPNNSIVITQGVADNTHFDLYLTRPSRDSCDTNFSSTSLAGRVFRDAGFLPNWHTGLLFLLTVPVLDTLEGEAKLWIEDDYFLPGYLLAHLDYSRRFSSTARAGLYMSYLSVLTANPKLSEQFLLRLREDAPKFSAAMIKTLLRDVHRPWHKQLYIELLNNLWHRPGDREIQAVLIQLVDAISVMWPESELAALNPELMAASMSQSNDPSRRMSS